MESPFIDTKEVAAYFGASEETVRYWRHTGRGPASVRVGRRVLYKRSDVVAWFDQLAEAEQRSRPA